jgi:AbrB family looped-hinge helix DNA binding protein
MSLVKVKTKGQVTIPTALRRRAGLNVGDLLEAKVERGKITLTPQSLVDRRIQEGLEDIRNGRTYGPFDSADEMIKSLQGNIKARSKARKPNPRSR